MTNKRSLTPLGYSPGKLSWTSTICDKWGKSIASYNHFIQLFRRVFDHSPEGKEVSGRLLTLNQGSRRAAEHALDFRTIAAESGWNESALKAVFRQGLNHNILIEMACCDDDTSLDFLIDLAIRLDNLLQDRKPKVLGLPPSAPKPMELGASQLTQAEQIWQRCDGLCFYRG